MTSLQLRVEKGKNDTEELPCARGVCVCVWVCVCVCVSRRTQRLGNFDFEVGFAWGIPSNLPH